MAKKKTKMNRKNIEFKKIIVIGYAYLSQGKHIATELKRLLKKKKKKRQEEEIKHRHKDGI